MIARLLMTLLLMLVLAGPAGAASSTDWVEASPQRIPHDAVKGGFVPSSDLYVCRGWYRDGQHVGKAFWPKCYIGWDGKEVALDRFQVLVERGGPRWRHHGRTMPPFAVKGGSTPAAGDLYVCRAFYRDGTHLGKVVDNRCLMGWGGQEVAVAPYEVLTARDAFWQEASGPEPPPGAVGGGRLIDGEMYVCRGFHEDGVHPGKLWDGKCRIGWGGREVALDRYEVLVRPGGLTWVKASRGQIPADCLFGAEAAGTWQCVCRGRFRDGLHIGKTHLGRCHIGWGGREEIIDDFQVLVER